MEALLILLTSWPAVYAIMAFPALMLLANFAFGQCTVAEFMDDRKEGSIDDTVTSARRKGKVAISLVLVFSLWQLICMNFVLTSTVERSVHAVMSIALLAIHASLITSRPQGKSEGAPFCRRCGCTVPNMDHHCYIIDNCVASTVNRSRFVTLCTLGVALSFGDLVAAVPSLLQIFESEESWWSGLMSQSEHRIQSVVAEVMLTGGFFGAIFVLLGSGYLLSWQIFLLSTGDTCVSRAKRLRNQRSGTT